MSPEIRTIRICRRDIPAVLGPILLSTWFLAFTAGCVSAAPPKAPVRDRDPDRDRKGLQVVVQETAGIDRPQGLVECGIPLPRGMLEPTAGITVRDGQDLIPARCEPLAFWPDGSVRWSKIVFFLPINANEKRTLNLTAGDKAPPVPLPADLPDIKLVLSSDNGRHEFKVFDGQRVEKGEFFLETDVEALSPDRIRVRTHVGQLQRDALWNDLSLEIAADGKVVKDDQRGAVRMGEWTAAIVHPVVRGPVTVSAGARGMTLSLYPASKLPPYPADEDFHVSHEVILARNADPTDLAKRVDAPLRAVLAPEFVADTGAAGIVCLPGKSSATFDASLQASLREIRRQMEEPVNRGWTAWGDFAADEGNAYMGYYNHEYDPASGLFQYYLHSGDLPALEVGFAMARQFADNCVGLSGGVYQHRSTSYALLGTVGDAAADAFIKQWRHGSGKPASDREIQQSVASLYGKKHDPKQRVSGLFTKRLQELTKAGVTDQAAREELAAQYAGYTIAESAMDEFKRGNKAIIKRVSLADPGVVQRNKGNKEPNPHDLALLYRAATGLVPLDKDMPASLDVMFRPFFQRYGGDWADFPRFHFYDAPDVELTHHGSHTLVEMLIWGHYLTGDVHLRRMALRVAEDFAADGGLADRATDRIAEMSAGKGLVHVRTGGWTLVNLLALLDLTQTAEPQLHATLQAKTKRLLKEILAIDPRRYEGVIHAGITTEALARYHRQYGQQDPKVARQALDRIIEIATLYAKEQWSDADHEFYYRVDNHKMTLEYGSYLLLFGLAYAAEHTEDQAVRSLLTDRIETLVAGAGQPAKTVKGFGMKFRSSYQALGVLEEPQGVPKR